MVHTIKRKMRSRLGRIAMAAGMTIGICGLLAWSLTPSRDVLAVSGPDIQANKITVSVETEFLAGSLWKIAGTTVTSTGAELNILDGVTTTAGELNYLDITAAGTAEASKALVLGSSKEIATITSATITTTTTSAIVGVNSPLQVTGFTSGIDVAGGIVAIAGGVPTSGNAAGGAATHSGGVGSGTGNGGAVTGTGGESGDGATGNGGAATLAGGLTNSVDGTGGLASVTGGAGTGTGLGGAGSLVGGAVTGSGPGGAVNIDGGLSSAGTEGSITIGTTNAEAVTVGRITKRVTLDGLIRIDRREAIEHYEEFLDDAGATEALPYKTDILTAGTVDYMADEPGGALQLAQTSGNAAEAQQLTWGNQRMIDTDKNPVIEFRIRFDNTAGANSAERWFVGIVADHTNSEDSKDNIDHSCWFLMKGTAFTTVLVEADDGTTDTGDQASGQTLSDDTYALFKIDMSDLADIKMYVNDVEQTGGTLDMSSSANQVVQPIVCFQRDDAGQTEAVMQTEIDYIQITQDR